MVCIWPHMHLNNGQQPTNSELSKTCEGSALHLQATASGGMPVYSALSPLPIFDLCLHRWPASRRGERDYVSFAKRIHCKQIGAPRGRHTKCDVYVGSTLNFFFSLLLFYLASLRLLAFFFFFFFEQKDLSYLAYDRFADNRSAVMVCKWGVFRAINRDSGPFLVAGALVARVFLVHEWAGM